MRTIKLLWHLWTIILDVIPIIAVLLVMYALQFGVAVR